MITVTGATATAGALAVSTDPLQDTRDRRLPRIAGSMEIRDVTMDFAYGESFTESGPEAYERLILDVLLGDANLFPRHQEVEESWRILAPEEADEMLARDGRSWRRP